MWTIVCFIDENCVEVVPAFWFKNGLCAWPKKNVKKHLNRRTIPNKLDFSYCKARALSKDIESLQVARSRLIHAEDTSELSSYDIDKSTRRIRHQIQVSDSDSENDYQMKSFNGKNKKKNSLKNVASVLTDPPLFQNNDVDTGDEVIKGHKDKNDVPNNQQAHNTIRNDKYEDIHETILDSDSILISPSGKWNITSLNNENIDMPASRKKLDFNHTPSRTTDLKKCFSTDGLQTTENNTKPFVRIIQSTSLSPVNSPNTTSCSNNKTDLNCSKTKKLHQESNQIAYLIDTVHQLIRSTSNLRFEMRELAKKIDSMDQKVTDNFANLSSEGHAGNNDLSDESSWDLPLTTIEDLELFEEKLSDKMFRKKVIYELSRHERSTVAETTRQITSKIFHNSLLAQFSYQGQKHKRVFSVLNSCSVIFNTVRSIRKYNNCPDIDISKPLKIYMANAKAREEMKQKKQAVANEQN